MSPKNKTIDLPVPNTPHDNFFVNCLSDLTTAKEFLLQHLPQPLLDVLDLTTLEIDHSRFVSSILCSRYADIVFKARLKNSQQTALIITHIEHQLTPKRDMPVRVLLYQTGVIKDYWYRCKQIPLVYSIVYYNGKEVWHYPTDLKAMINASADLIDRYFLQPFQLIHSKEVPDEASGQTFLLDLMQITMGHIHDSDMLPVFKEKIMGRLITAEKHGRQDLILIVIYYIISTGEISDKNAFYALVDSQLSQETGEKVMTLAQQWREEGRQEEREKTMTLAQQWREEGRQEEREKTMTLAQQWREEGHQEERLIVAASMLEQGFSPEVIAQVTGLSV